MVHSPGFTSGSSSPRSFGRAESTLGRFRKASALYPLYPLPKGRGFTADTVKKQFTPA
jgi:hypothetical protein